MIGRQHPMRSGLASLFATAPPSLTENFAKPIPVERWFGGRFQMAPPRIDPEAVRQLLEGLQAPLFEGGAPPDWQQMTPRTMNDAEPESALLPAADLYYQHSGPDVPRPREYQLPGERRPWSRPGVDLNGLEWLMRRRETL